MSIINHHIDTHLIKYLYINDVRCLYQVNRYYHNLLKDILTNFIDFYSVAKTIDLPIYIKYNYLFNKSIIFGKLDVCQYLYKKHNINIFVNNNESFILSCYRNKLDIAKWIFSIDKNINIHENRLFPNSCHYGSLDILKWLYSLGFDVDSGGYYAFRLSCDLGHIHIAKWIFSLGIIPIDYIDSSFEVACRRHHVELAKWFCSIDSRYHITIFDDKIDSTIIQF